ncbi:MAG: glycoside hydrolase family 2 protein [Limnochordia bacterium]
MPDLPRSEYPRPDCVRAQWLCLNGPWRFAFDDAHRGLREQWYNRSEPFEHVITVPFAYQTPLSGINVQDHHPVVWYKRDLIIPQEWGGKRILLHFGAVDYKATVWVNGQFVGEHEGGYVPFYFDITDYLASNGNEVTVRVEDDVRFNQPRGKQSARKESWACWYTPVTGIWQSVWLEPVAQTHLTQLHMVPDIDTETLTVHYWLSELPENLSLELIASAEGREIIKQIVPVPPRFVRWSDIKPLQRGHCTLVIPQPQYWSPESPFLYDLTIRVKVAGEVVDEVGTYFGMRKVHAERGQVFLNNRAYYQRLVLDQGYWEEGLYTAPTHEAIRQDVEQTKAMGFNGARKHQKIEDPYYYYYADKLGLLVWSEMPACYEYDEEGAERLRREWIQAVKRDRNHPCIIAWTPLNESWGVDQLQRRKQTQIISYMLELYHLTKSLDPTRLVISNDGWQHALTDLLTIHEYTQDPTDLKRRLEAFSQNPHAAVFSHGVYTLLQEFPYNGAPILVTEFGGTRVEAQGSKGWGYGDAVSDYDAWVERIGRLVAAVTSRPDIVGYCYTQLTDVKQEVNGLLTAEHAPKVDPEKLKAAFVGR